MTSERHDLPGSMHTPEIGGRQRELVLTPFQRKVAELWARGMKLVEIARRFGKDSSQISHTIDAVYKTFDQYRAVRQVLSDAGFFTKWFEEKRKPGATEAMLETKKRRAIEGRIVGKISYGYLTGGKKDPKIQQLLESALRLMAPERGANPLTPKQASYRTKVPYRRLLEILRNPHVYKAETRFMGSAGQGLHEPYGTPEIWRRLGAYVTKPKDCPFGYRFVGPGRRTREPDPVEAKIVKEVHRLRQRRMTEEEINEKVGPRIHKLRNYTPQTLEDKSAVSKLSTIRRALTDKETYMPLIGPEMWKRTTSIKLLPRSREEGAQNTQTIVRYLLRNRSGRTSKIAKALGLSVVTVNMQCKKLQQKSITERTIPGPIWRLKDRGKAKEILKLQPHEMEDFFRQLVVPSRVGIET